MKLPALFAALLVTAGLVSAHTGVETCDLCVDLRALLTPAVATRPAARILTSARTRITTRTVGATMSTTRDDEGWELSPHVLVATRNRLYGHAAVDAGSVTGRVPEGGAALQPPKKLFANVWSLKRGSEATAV